MPPLQPRCHAQHKPKLEYCWGLPRRAPFLFEGPFTKTSGYFMHVEFGRSIIIAFTQPTIVRTKLIGWSCIHCRYIFGAIAGQGNLLGSVLLAILHMEICHEMSYSLLRLAIIWCSLPGSGKCESIFSLARCQSYDARQSRTSKNQVRHNQNIKVLQFLSNQLHLNPGIFLETIHESQIPILILDTVRQVHGVVVRLAIPVFQLRVENRFMSCSFQLEIDVRCCGGEVVGAPMEFTC